MKKHNENQFIEKFRFLHSQESSDEISWSCSDSSDYEYSNIQSRALNNITNDIRRKRKRVSNRKNDQTNISNLDVTINDGNSELKNPAVSAKSPILVGKSRTCVRQKSPILTPLQLPSKKLSVSENDKHILKSPIIIFKSNSTKVSPKVRKKLFEGEKCNDKKDLISSRSSPALSKNKDCLDRRKNLHTLNSTTPYKLDSSAKKRNQYGQYNGLKINLTDRIKECPENEEINIESTQTSSEESVPKNSHTELVAKVKSYFDNHFISEASQLSISESDTPTPKNSSKSSNEVDIATPRTQERIVSTSSRVSPANTLETMHIVKKKINYRKGGLAFRLNGLLKKQSSSVNLWQHEKFLAANSNFVIPKQEFLVFRIKNISFKYGIYCLEIVSKDDECFIVIINNVYVNNNMFKINSILKIYEPYRIVNLKDRQIITNISKFECQEVTF